MSQYLNVTYLLSESTVCICKYEFAEAHRLFKPQRGLLKRVAIKMKKKKEICIHPHKGCLFKTY